MLTNPSIRCPECGCVDLEAHLVNYSHGGKDVSGFTCRACGFGWEAWETPQFSSPNYATAYVGAPDLVGEELALVLLAEDIKSRATAALSGQGPTVEPFEHREFFLRKAAFLDRAARDMELDVYRGLYVEADVDRASTMAASAAFEFLKFDLEHGGVGVAGPIGPGSPEWDIAGGTRAYVRQEMRAWLDQEQEDEDRAQMLPHRGPDGELYDGDGKAL
jgi:hypothetical protein